LKVLTLGLNKLDDKSFKKPLFEEMTQMLELRIYGNPGITQIPEDVYKLQSLERLFMGNNSITSVQDSMTYVTYVINNFLEKKGGKKKRVPNVIYPQIVR
jgi:Leucine-rich repeat (LRR) protein